MKCRRSEELWSDYIDDTLPSPLRTDLEEHLEDCPDCSSLLASFREVRGLLGSLPRLQPAPDLVERISSATRPRLAGQRQPQSLFLPGLPLPLWGQWATWALTAALVVVLLVRPSAVFSDMGAELSRLGHRAYSYGLQVYLGSERLIDELNVLRMTVGVAFEDRLDRLNERLKDLEEARRRSEDLSEKESHLAPPLQLTYVPEKPEYPESRSLS